MLSPTESLQYTVTRTEQVALEVRNLPASTGDVRDISWVGRIPWRRKWLPTPVLLSGGSRGQSNLVGYGPWGRKKWVTAEAMEQA